MVRIFRGLSCFSISASSFASIASFVAGFAFAASLNASTTDANLQLVTRLPQLEVAESAMLMNNGFVFVGASRENDQDTYKLKIFKASDQKLMQTIQLKHSLYYFAAVDQNTIVVTGKTIDPWLSHITTVRYEGGRFTTKTVQIPNQMLVEHVVSYQGNLFFSDPGTRSIYKFQGGSLSKFVTGISNPGPLLIKNNYLVVLERAAFEPGDENIVRVNLNDMSIQRLYPVGQGLGRGVTHITDLKGSKLIAMNEWAVDNVQVIDIETMSKVKEAEVNGMPEAMSQVKKCLVIATTQSLEIKFYTYNTDQMEMVDRWSFASQPELLKSVRAIEVDASIPDRVGVFMRSTYPCSGGSDCAGGGTHSSIFRIEDDARAILKACN